MTQVQPKDELNPFIEAGTITTPSATKDNVIPLRTAAMGAVTAAKMNAATIIGDLNAPEAQAVLALPVIYGEAMQGAPYVAGDAWTRRSGTWLDQLDWLTKHPIRADKGGRAFFFAASDTTGRSAWGKPLCFKVKDQIRSVYAVAVDVDGVGVTIDSMVAKLQSLSLFAVLYTTHSHTTKGEPGVSDRFRIILPLATPFALGDGDNRTRRDEYAARYVSLMDALFVPSDSPAWDVRGLLPDQMMYAPARPNGAEYKHYIVTGRALDLMDYSPGDTSRFRRSAPKGVARGVPQSDVPAFLSDGFDLLAWHRAHGADFDLESALEWVGWEVLGPAGAGFDILCPNAAEHSEGETAWAVNGPDSTGGALIYCHHAHCTEHRTCDFLRMIEEHAALPDGFDSFSAVLCDPRFYPDAPGGGETLISGYDFGVLRPVERLNTAEAVQAAWAAESDHDDASKAAICAGVIHAGNPDSARNKLDGLLGGNERRRKVHWDAGGAHLARWRKAQKVKGQSEQKKDFRPSLEPASPLGNTPTQKLDSLSARFRLVNVKGKVLVIRSIDRRSVALGDDVLEFWTKDSLRQYYAHEAWAEGEGQHPKWVNPVDRWWSDARRHNRVIFDPSGRERSGDVNLFDLDLLALDPADAEPTPIQAFVRDVICGGDRRSYDWVTLWLAHLVQFPAERPGTALVLYGPGGVGKGTFGRIVRRLVEPYDMLATDPEHLIGRFAGPALATSLVVVSEEAVFGRSNEAADKLKGMITQRDMRVESKGVQSVQMDVFFRLIIDSNHDAAVRIEGNNSERRYMVLNVSSALQGQKEAFARLYDHIAGSAMRGYLRFLKNWNPADAGLDWADVRTAPETIHRRKMFADSLRSADKALLRILEDGEFIWRAGAQTHRVLLAEDAETRIPATAIDDYLRSQGGRYDSDLRPMVAGWKNLFGEALARPKRARLSVEHQIINEAETTMKGKTAAGQAWEAFDLNLQTYSLPALCTIRAMIEARTGQKVEAE